MRFHAAFAPEGLGPILIVLTTAAVSWGLDPASSGTALDALDGLVGRWMALRTAIAAEQREWASQRVQWEREIELLERESAWLASEITVADTDLDAMKDRQEEWLARQRALATEESRLDEIFKTAEARLRRWELDLPCGLRSQMPSRFDPLKCDQNLEAVHSLASRARNLVAIYSQIEQLNQHCNISREILETGGGVRRQVDVLHLGLALAWAVSQNDDWAAMGVYSIHGWNWRTVSEHASNIRVAIEVLNRKHPPRWTELPVVFGGEPFP